MRFVGTRRCFFNDIAFVELKNKWTTIGSKNSLFAFRVADVNMTTVPLLNVNDASELARKWASGFQEFYTTLK